MEAQVHFSNNVMPRGDTHMSINHATRLALVFFVGLTLADPVMALRCDRKIIDEGMPQAEVRKYCGEPTSTLERTVVRAGIPRRLSRPQSDQLGSQELVIPNRGYEEVLVDEWTYNFGRQRFMYMIRFENGFVTLIKKLGYGYND